ncbi:MAG TPA: ATP-binding cassette domain-containing protein [Bacilli bacterium]|nr:ATP-binding cassette domain-containing protein [Bacilli bacterium]
MIEIKALVKRFHKNIVLDDMNLNLPRTGIIGIYGRSGSGKSTMLKILAGLLKFQGHISVNNENLELLDIDQLCDYRLRNVGLIFQTYRLFEHETVTWNLALPLLLLGYDKWSMIQKHVEQSLISVGLPSFGQRKVATLSGGEKQRVAFARALIKQPRIILADEPTSALDDQNKQMLMHRLASYSSQRLVIIVSHDRALLSEYAHICYQMVDGKLVDKKILHANKDVSRRTMIRLKHNGDTGTLPFSFCFRHAIYEMKSHKWRHFLSQVMLAIALVALGIGIQVTASINDKVQSTIKHLIGPAGLELRADKANHSGLKQVYAADFVQVEQVAKRYPDYVSDIGVVYQTNIDDFFPQRNELFVISEGPIVILPSFSARHLTEPLGFDELGLDRITLRNDEVALMLPETDIKLLAQKIGSLANADQINMILANKTIFLGAGFANTAWTYEDEQVWRLVKVHSGEHALVIHSNPLFSEAVLEQSMRFPATTDLSATHQLPWMLKKTYYLKTDDAATLSAILYKDLELFGMRFDYVSNTHMKSYCPRLGRCVLQRVLVLLDPYQSLSLSHLNYIIEAEPRLNEPILTTSGGYLLYPESMFAGFANETLFAIDQHHIDQVIDWLSFTSPGQMVVLPPAVARGHYQDQSGAAVKLKQSYGCDYIGRLPIDVHEIAISSGLARRLNASEYELGDSLYIATRIVTTTHEQGTSSEFITTDHQITAIVDDDDLSIYGCSLWSVSYYRDLLGFSGDSLRIERAYFAGQERLLNDSARRIMATFHHLQTSLPQMDMRQSLSNLTRNIDAGIYALATIAGVNSLMLAALVLRLAWLDIAKDKTLLFELGARPGQISRLLTARAIILVFGSLLSAILQMIIAAFLIEQALANYFHTHFFYSFPSVSIVTMTLFSVVIFILLQLVSHRLRHHHALANA